MRQRTLAALGIAAAGAAIFLPRRRPYRFAGRSALISGGSRGLGLLLARALAREGARLTLLARDAAELERARAELAAGGAEVQVVAGDVADEADAARAIHAARAAYGGLDVLINCAGIIQAGPLAAMTRRDFAEAMDVHFWGAYNLTVAALPLLRDSDAGRVVNIASIGGRVAVPHLLPYCASKFALVGLSDGLRAELAAEGVRVTTVVPGLMRTGSHMNARFKGRQRQEFSWFAVLDALPLFSIDAERAAGQIVAACRAGAPALTISWQARAAELAQAAAPGLTARLLAATSRLLPRPPEVGGGERRSGWQSQSAIAPSPLTAPADRATLRNNELP